MNYLVRAIFIAGLSCLSLSTFAAKDPISWSLNRGLSNPSIVGRTYTFQYTLTNQLPVQLAKALSISKNGSPSSDFSYTDNCTGAMLASGASCTVDVSFTPQTSGNKSFQLVIGGYDNNSVPLTQLTTVAEGDSVPSNTVYGMVNTSLPANISLGQSSQYSFTFTNGTSAAISGLSTNVSQSSGTATFTSTCGTTLAAGKSCIVTGEFVPEEVSPTTQSVSATFTYTGGSITKSTSGTVTSSAGVQASFVYPNELPAEMIGGASNTKRIQVKFFNNTGSTITNTARNLAITTGGGSGTLTLDTSAANDNCLIGAAQLLNGQACVVTGTFEGNVVGADTQVIITGSLNYTGATGSPATISTSTYLVPSLTTSRTISLVNNCNFPVWWSFSGSAVAGTSSASCPAGTSANQIDSTKECHWTNPGPNTGSSYMLTASGGNNTATIPLNTGTDPSTQWSGIVSASLLCDNDGTNCTVAPCDKAGGDQSCKSGAGFNGPVTQAEFTFKIATDDSYDVEVINGFHIPISITPGSHTSADNYECGVPGNFIAANNFGSCNWQNAVVPGNGYYVVTSGGEACNISSPSCTAGGEVCGIALDNTNKTTNMSCGKFLGFWSADEVCGFNPTKGGTVANTFQCYTPLSSSYPTNANYFDLMKCAVPTGDDNPLYNSCYLSYPSSTAAEIATCCGCVDWWTLAGVSANSNTASCGSQTNATWNQVMQGQVEWMKKTCPSVYVYPFDDKTSGFSCTNNLAGDSNSTNYTVTFCPGNTGKPAGIDDGRIP